MPTARELLEQADALMRRNRSAVADDIPVLTEAVSPPPVLRVPLRPSPESSPMPLADAVGEAEAAPDVIPTLTEKVPPGEPEREGAVLAEGEPSDWLEFEEGEPSITGLAPNSVMSVPEVVSAEALREAPGAGVEEPPSTEEIELAPAAEAEFEAELSGGQAPESAPEVPPPPSIAEAPSARTPWPDTELPPEVDALPALAAEAEMALEPPSAVSWNVEAVLAGPEGRAAEEAVAAEAGPLPSAEAEEAPTAFAASPATEADEPMLAQPEVEPEVEPDAESGVAAHPAPAWESPFATLPAAIEAPIVVPPPPAAPAPPPPDDARWEAMAEEIRMQVLQRIDLFTDTGLREQLGRQLQPIVDRASADLVRTINQHVGELLRAYVAEAIEREIERWRSSQ